MKKALFTAALLAMAATGISTASAHHHSINQFNSEDFFGWPGDDGGFNAATLNGTYIFEARGTANGAGEVVILGTLTFDGGGNGSDACATTALTGSSCGTVTGNLVVTEAVTGQASCTDSFTTGGSYAITPSNVAPGLGSMVLPMGTGTINLALLIPRAAGVTAKVIEADNGALTVGAPCTGGATLTSLALVGELRGVPQGDWH